MIRALTIILLTFFWTTLNGQTRGNLDYVDPFIGTDGIGHTFPGATTPLGMVQLSPSSDTHGWNWCSGYHHGDNILKGFAHTHFSGTGLTGMGDILLTATTAIATTAAGSNKDPDSGYRSRFSHDNEYAKAGYYSVYLDDNRVKVELTASSRVGVHRYTFSDAGSQNIIIDPTHGVSQRLLGSTIEIISDREIVGSKHAHDSSCGDRCVYFYAKFSQPFDTYCITVDDKPLADIKSAEDENVKAYVSYNGDRGNVVEVKVGISFVSIEGAKENYTTEAKGKDFDKIYTEAQQLWQQKIDKIDIEGTQEQKTIFYTGLYHNFITPNIISDVNGDCIIDGKRYNFPDMVQYSNFSFWDTYRATHPLWTIIDQESSRAIADVLISRYTTTKTGLALWEALGFDNCCMPGYAGISVLAEIALKMPEGLDLELIYDYIRQTSFRDDKYSAHYGSDNGVRYYTKYGFIPAEVGCSVAKTTENNYYDFSIAQLARRLGKEDDVQLFTNRSLGHRQLFNKRTNYLWPRELNGDFIKMDTTSWHDLIPNYVSGNIWAYSTYTPHDMLGAITLWGGADRYSAWLDYMVNNEMAMGGEEHVDIAGFIGKYSHGDEPGHQLAYLYNFTGEPWKSQALVSRVAQELYSWNRDGMPNNEDCGQMSAWYLFSAMGFYPTAPTDLNYYIGSPQLESATINLESGKSFRVVAKGVSNDAKYIKSARLNGKPLDRVYITHDEIMASGELIFEMSASPNKEWGVGKSALPVYQREMAKIDSRPLAQFRPSIEDKAKLYFSTETEVRLKSVD